MDENATDTAPIESISIANESQSQFSGLTASESHTPASRDERINIGQHPTPENLTFNVNEGAYEEGYDSGGQLGPHLDAVFGEIGEGFFEECIPVSNGNVSDTETVNLTGTGTSTNTTTNIEENLDLEEPAAESNRKFTMADQDIKNLLKKVFS